MITRSNEMGGASKSLFNLSARDLKGTNKLGEPQTDLFFLRNKERVMQVACGAVHSLVRTNIDRVFSCGNGSTFALGHGNRDTLS